MFQKAILMAMVQRSRLMQQETLWARVNGLREGGSTMDTQICSSLKPVEVLVWKIFLRKKNRNTFWHQSTNNISAGRFQQRRKRSDSPEAGDLVALCSVERLLGHSVSMVRAHPAVTEEVIHLSCLEVLYGHLIYIPFMGGNFKKHIIYRTWVISMWQM